MALPIVVFGATGKQGGSVVKYLLQEPKYQVIGVTRNTESESAKALSQQGVKLVKADFTDKDSLQRAVQGAHGVFLVVDPDFFADDLYESEFGRVQLFADILLKAGVEKVVYTCWSKYGVTDPKKCGTLDSKTDGFLHLKAAGVPVAGVVMMSYHENIFDPTHTRKVKDGVHEFSKWNSYAYL